MQFQLTIDCNNAAFVADPPNDTLTAYMRRQEVARILQVAAVKVGRDDASEGKLIDINGNQCGSFWFEETE